VTIRPTSRRQGGGRVARRVAGIAGGALCWLALAAPALAHGEVTGVQDVVQDYGVLLFLAATVLIGAGVLAWVTFSPQPDEEDEAAGEAPGGAQAGGAPGAPGAGSAVDPAPAAAPPTPEGSRASR